MYKYPQDYSGIDFREHPELYQIGRGEQGVLLVEPYKSEILPYWRFRTVAIAHESANKIYQLFLGYKDQHDFVGMDMARKYLQMGYTRARRYANHRSGTKYVSNPQKEADYSAQKEARQQILPQEDDWASSEKAQAAQVFYEKYLLALRDSDYVHLKGLHKEKYFPRESDN